MHKDTIGQEPLNQAYRISVRGNQSVMGVGSNKGCMFCIWISTSKTAKRQIEDLEIDMYAEGVHQFSSSTFN